jgi:hypothetical protein
MATNSNTADDAIFDNDSDVTDVDTGAVGVAAVRTPTAPVPDCACWAVMENYAALITEATHVDDRVGGAPVTDAVVKEGGDVAAVATVDEFDVVEVVATQLFKWERGTLHRVDAGLPRNGEGFLMLRPVGLQRVSRIGPVTSMPRSCAGAECCRSPDTTPPPPGVRGLWW